jgi:hypothetical protein
MFKYVGKYGTENNMYNAEIELPYQYIKNVNFDTKLVLSNNLDIYTYNLTGYYNILVNGDQIFIFINNDFIDKVNEYIILHINGNIVSGYFKEDWLEVKLTETCEGCLTFQPNQEAHYGFGGCLEKQSMYS